MAWLHWLVDFAVVTQLSSDQYMPDCVMRRHATLNLLGTFQRWAISPGASLIKSKRPVISTQAVPKERMRLDTATVTEQRQVSDQLRKEQINAEGVDAGRHSR